MKAIRIAAVILAMGYASDLPAADKQEKTKSPAKSSANKQADKTTAKQQTSDAHKGATQDNSAVTEQGTGERSRKTDTAPSNTTPAPQMQPTNPMNPDPMRPGTPPTFPRNESSPQTPVKPTDPTAPTIVK